MQWAVAGEPTAFVFDTVDSVIGETFWGIQMTAASATSHDGSDVSYFFECINVPALSSQWQLSETYQVFAGRWSDVEGLQFRVRARDASKQMTEWSLVTAYSFNHMAPTGDLNLSLTAVDHNSVTLEASVLADPNGVEYLFVLEEPAEAFSQWLSFGESQAPTYVFTELEPDSYYRFRYKVRDLSTDQLDTQWSGWLSLKTTSPVPDTILTPDPMVWAEEGQPKAILLHPEMGDWGWAITMTATEVTDVNGSVISYQFGCSDAYLDSSWQGQRDYVIEVGHRSLIDDFKFRVKAINEQGNETEWSHWAQASPVP
jgi:hypothetical protein